MFSVRAMWPPLPHGSTGQGPAPPNDLVPRGPAEGGAAPAGAAARCGDRGDAFPILTLRKANARGGWGKIAPDWPRAAGTVRTRWQHPAVTTVNFGTVSAFLTLFAGG